MPSTGKRSFGVSRVLGLRYLVFKDFLADFTRFIAHSSTLEDNRRDKLLARIAAKYHSIEKGLSLPEPRLGFGREPLRQLITYIRRYGPDAGGETLAGARDTIGAYVRLHEKHDCENYPFRNELKQLLKDMKYPGDPAAGGLREVSRDEIRQVTAAVTDDFFLKRHSVRQFSGATVSLEDIDGAIRVAQKAPVVCNRQSGRVHIVSDSALRAEVLRLQAGAKGFGQELDKVLAVTSDLSNFWDVGERNQCWVDGGLFAMSLDLWPPCARTRHEISLNWSKSAAHSKKLRALLDLEASEVIIMLIGVGHLRERFAVPYSNRKDLSAVRKVH